MSIIEQFVTRTGTPSGVANHRMTPVDVEGEDLPRCERFRKLDSHHRVDHRELEVGTIWKRHPMNVAATLPLSQLEVLSHGSE